MPALRRRAFSVTTCTVTLLRDAHEPAGTFVYDQTTNQRCKFVTSGYAQWNFANGTMWGQRIIGGDMLTIDVWEMGPGALFDNGAAKVIHIVTGGITTRNRIYHSVYSFRLACSVGRVLDPNGASLTLSSGDDQGQTWITMDTIPISEGNTTQEIEWLSLGSFAAPGRIFKTWTAAASCALMAPTRTLTILMSSRRPATRVSCGPSQHLMINACASAFFAAALCLVHDRTLWRQAQPTGETMPLEFRGAAVIDPPGRSIRFAGVPTGGRQSAMVICEVSSAALRSLCDIPPTDREGLLRAFNEHQKRIWEAASRKFDHGEHRPVVSLEDLAPK